MKTIKALLLTVLLTLAFLAPMVIFPSSARAQTFSAQIQQFWNQLSTGAIAFSTGRVQTSGYLNFGAAVGTAGYGFRDSAGTMQYKDSAGVWASFPSGGVAPTFAVEPTPVAPTAALAGAGAGNVDNGTHVYQQTCITPTGQSIASASSSPVTVVDKTANGKVTVTLTYCSAFATGRNVYRSKAGTTTPLFLITTSPMIANGVATATYTDNTADASLTATTAPTTTTTLDARYFWPITGGPLQQGGFCVDAASTQCLYQYSSTAMGIEGRVLFTNKNTTNSRTNANKTFYGIISAGGFNSTTGGLYQRGVGSATMDDAATVHESWTQDATTYPALLERGIYNATPSSGSIAAFQAAGTLWGVCWTAGNSWCETYESGLSAQPILKLLGSGQLSLRVSTSAGAAPGAATYPGFQLNNLWPATVGAQAQWSPGHDQCGSGWNTGGTPASNFDCWRTQIEPAGGNPTTSLYRWLSSNNSVSSFTSRMTLTDTGVLSGPTYASSGSGMAVANVGANSCGTSTATIAGNNNAFVITVGATSGTQCRVTFTVAATTEWDCAANDDTTTVAVRTTPIDTTHTDLIGAFTAGDKVTGICFPR